MPKLTAATTTTADDHRKNGCVKYMQYAIFKKMQQPTNHIELRSLGIYFLIHDRSEYEKYNNGWWHHLWNDFDNLFKIWIIIFLSLYSLLTIVTCDLTYLIFYCDTGVGNIRQLLFNNCSKYDYRAKLPPSILDKCQHWVVSVKIGTRADDITLWDEFDKLF